MVLPPRSLNTYGGTTIFPGPASVPAVRLRSRRGSGIVRCGRASEKSGFARRASATGWVRIVLSIFEVAGSVATNAIRVSSSVGVAMMRERVRWVW